MAALHVANLAQNQIGRLAGRQPFQEKTYMAAVVIHRNSAKGLGKGALADAEELEPHAAAALGRRKCANKDAAPQPAVLLACDLELRHGAR